MKCFKINHGKLIMALLFFPFIARAFITTSYNDDFERRKELLFDSSCFEIFSDSSLTGDRREAMKFLYAYLPLPDISSYPPEFFLANVDAALKARGEMPWGRDIPEREFLHFVLPLRVNNEMLDSFRTVYYDELRGRVGNMSVEDAILEVNHWCHEKVSYQPSDGRTSNPLSTISQAIGRCGEESTFTVAALRTVGIPARQVYTPRWAHTDDNHAWVEAWANGKWHFIGACEPEPVLDLAWFNQPASRGLIMNTTVFGKYDGPEEKFNETEITTTINVTSNYAPTDTLRVRVTDINGLPLKDIPVNFCIYNYADFYPVTSQKTDSEGLAQITCGMGDMIVWGSDGRNFGFVKGHPGAKIWELTLDKDGSFSGEFEMDIVPPPAGGITPDVPEEMRRENEKRLAQEDKIRKDYISTFIGTDRAVQTAKEKMWNEEVISDLLPKSRGNHRVILNFLNSLSPSDFPYGLALLSSISEKDLRDITPEILHDNMTGLKGELSDDLFAEYVLNPRVENEPLVAYKSYFRNVIPADIQARAASEPGSWVDWVDANIEADSLWNPQNIHINPISVWKQKKADKRSKSIFFVSSIRSMGVPARIDRVTGKTQYHDGREWIEVNLDEHIKHGPTYPTPAPSSKVKLKLDYNPDDGIRKPVYYSHFAIHRLENGFPRQLEFDEGMTLEEISGSLLLDEGPYMLLTGQRMSDGSVLVKGDFINLKQGGDKTVAMSLRRDSEKIGIIGSLNAENLYYDVAGGKEKSILSTTGRGNYILGIIKAGSEPSAHALNDISQRAEDFENLKEKMVVLFTSSEDCSRFNPSAFPGLPSTVCFGVDESNAILKEIMESLALSDDNLPLFVIADSFNRIMYVSQGYTIGLGDRLLNVLSKIDGN